MAKTLASEDAAALLGISSSYLRELARLKFIKRPYTAPDLRAGWARYEEAKAAKQQARFDRSDLAATVEMKWHTIEKAIDQGVTVKTEEVEVARQLVFGSFRSDLDNGACRIAQDRSPKDDRDTYGWMLRRLEDGNYSVSEVAKLDLQNAVEERARAEAHRRRIEHCDARISCLEAGGDAKALDAADANYYLDAPEPEWREYLSNLEKSCPIPDKVRAARLQRRMLAYRRLRTSHQD